MTLPGRLLLIGHPVSHSLSPAMMNAALSAAGIDLEYVAVDVAPSELTAAVRSLRRDAAAGNVTIPHKEEFAAHCDSMTAAAAAAGAANSFRVDGNQLIGHNTDVAGFDRALRAELGRHGLALPRSVTVVGAGGAASAVLASMSTWDDPPRKLRILSRTPSRADRLARRHPSLPIEREPRWVVSADTELVVNATPIGLLDDELPVPPAALPPESIVFDLVYRRGETRFVREARAAGHVSFDGLRMLLEQGAEGFRDWFGFEPDRGAMWTALKVASGRV